MTAKEIEWANMLSEEANELQKQILTKYTRAILEEVREQLRIATQKKRIAESTQQDITRERDQCIDIIRTIYAEFGEDVRISELCNTILDHNMTV